MVTSFASQKQNSDSLKNVADQDKKLSEII
jgi:hypothetical protein